MRYITFIQDFLSSINNSCETVCIIGRKINVLSTTSQFYTVCWIDGTRAAQHLLVRGHSTATWTKFYPILIHHTLQVDKNGRSKNPLPRDPCGLPHPLFLSTYLLNVPLFEWSLQDGSKFTTYTVSCIFARSRELISYKFNKYTKA